MKINTNEPEKIYTSKTLGGVFAQKVLNFFAENTIASVVWKLTELSLGMFLGVFIYRPVLVSNFLFETLKTQNYAFPKIAAALGVYFFRKRLFKLFKRCSKLVQKSRVPKAEKLIDGIPVNELADYLIRNGNFRREGANGIRETFGISNMEKFNRLANNLERRKILKRGENNMRVLDGRWSRQALIDFLGQSERSGEAENWFRVFKLGDASAKIRLDRKEIQQAL